MEVTAQYRDCKYRLKLQLKLHSVVTPFDDHFPFTAKNLVSSPIITHYIYYSIDQPPDFYVYYRLATKLREGNVLVVSVCPLTGGGVPCDHYPWCIGHHHTKLVHYAARTVGKRTVNILLECFLVFTVHKNTLCRSGAGSPGGRTRTDSGADTGSRLPQLQDLYPDGGMLSRNIPRCK